MFLIKNQKIILLKPFLSAFVALSLIFSTMTFPWTAQAQGGLNLPAPGAMLSTSPAYIPPHLVGMTVNLDDPFQFNFIVDSGDFESGSDELKEVSNKLIRYFLAALTIPEEDLWVNLSPYEKDRIIPNEFGKTEMGQDLLAQDYILKQLTASLMYPEESLGESFWSRVYKRMYDLYGAAEVPVNTFHKVWIVPDKAVVHEHEKTVVIVNSHLKVMLEKDYLATNKSFNNSGIQSNELTKENVDELGDVSSEVIRNILLPEIEKEVNEGEYFAPLRQIYYSMVLASWYKKKLRTSPLNFFYADQKKIVGVDAENEGVKEKIYDQYIEAFREGVFDYIKEDYDAGTQQVVPRKYFAGGVGLSGWDFAQGNIQDRESNGQLYELGAILRQIQKSPQGSPAALFRLFLDYPTGDVMTFEDAANKLGRSVNTIRHDFYALFNLGLLEKMDAKGYRLKVGIKLFGIEIFDLLDNLPTSQRSRLSKSQSESLKPRINNILATKNKGTSSLSLFSLDQFEVPEVRDIWEYLQSEIRKHDPYIDQKREGILARTYRQLNRTLYSIDQKVKAGKIKLVSDVNLLKAEIAKQSLNENGEPVKIGVLALSANPLNWSHINSQLMHIDEENLNFVAFLVQGGMKYKDLPQSDIVPEKNRHAASNKFLDKMHPLLQSTDVGRGTEKIGEFNVHEIFKLNPNREMTINYFAGTENVGRVKGIIRHMIQGMREQGFPKHPKQKLVLTFIPIDDLDQHNFSDQDLQGLVEEIAREEEFNLEDSQFEAKLILKDYHDLDLTIHSTWYRRGDRSLVPSIVDEMAQEHGYYGYPPRVLVDGQWVTMSMDEVVKERLKPLVKSLAEKISKEYPDGNAIVSIDGHSASGKSLVARMLQNSLQELHPGRMISLFGTDALLKDRKLRHAIQKWVVNDPLDDDELALVPDSIKNNVERGGIYTGEESFFNNEEILRYLNEARIFFDSTGTEGKLVIKDPYDQKTKKKSDEDLEIPLARGGYLIVEGKYAQLPALAEVTDLKIRVEDDLEAVRVRFELRTRQLSPDDADRQLKFFNQSLALSFEKYKEATQDHVNLILDMSSEHFEDWKIIDNFISMGENVGGIDFHSKWLEFQNQGEEQEMIFNFDPKQFQNFQMEGLMPVIYNVRPLPSLVPMLSQGPAIE